MALLCVYNPDLSTLCLVRRRRESHFEIFPHLRSVMKYSVEVQENCCSMQERTASLLTIGRVGKALHTDGS